MRRSQFSNSGYVSAGISLASLKNKLSQKLACILHRVSNHKILVKTVRMALHKYIHEACMGILLLVV